ncbi:LacI family DNA-binding transcriptional regulator [Microbacterium sp. NPDC096154]|uniref:LacI family DNA-binding transcriptional regulator n=1 Tax=Microbacterium sp. NPDC096154 TaxID=3155549 RepID=UPI00332574B3
MAATRPRLADIAAEADVSVSTASKVLSGRADIAEATRQRVLATARALGYRSRGAAAPGDRHGLVELLIGGIGTLWALEVVRGAEAAVARHGKSLIVTNMMHEGFSMAAWADSVLAHRSTGVIVATARAGQDELDRLRAAGVPLVRLDAAGNVAADTAQVGVTNWAGMRDATQHLIDLGHRRIGFITGEPEAALSLERQEGYTAALRRNDIPVDPELIRPGDFMIEGGEAGARALLDLPEPPTAIVASSDLEAMGVYHAAFERGLRIPDDLSVVGFDDTVLCGYLSPSLTTVRQPLAQMADQAVRLLGDLAHGAHPPLTRIELATTLITRESTAAPRR